MGTKKIKTIKMIPDHLPVKVKVENASSAAKELSTAKVQQEGSTMDTTNLITSEHNNTSSRNDQYTNSINDNNALEIEG